jgi:hypothetical protein
MSPKRVYARLRRAMATSGAIAPPAQQIPGFASAFADAAADEPLNPGCACDACSGSAAACRAPGARRMAAGEQCPIAGRCRLPARMTPALGLPRQIGRCRRAFLRSRTIAAAIPWPASGSRPSSSSGKMSSNAMTMAFRESRTSNRTPAAIARLWPRFHAGQSRLRWLSARHDRPRVSLPPSLTLRRTSRSTQATLARLRLRQA